jgi:hypothetical protein
MLSRMTFVSLTGCAVLWGASGLTVQSLFAQTSQKWTLPQGTVKDNGPRTYRFTVTYSTANTKGEIVQRQRLTGDYTRGLTGGDVVWKNVSREDANGATGPFGPPQKRDFMEGFRYHNDMGVTFTPEFFRSFPVTAVFERNLVWDTGMMETFGQNYLDHLKLNEPYTFGGDQDVAMPGVGTFRNKKVELEWVGFSQRNGQDCALIQYQAFFNPLSIANGGMTLVGRSDYWGEVWVSLATKQIEYGTLYENVQGELKLAGQNAQQNISVFRIGTFEPVSK